MKKNSLKIIISGISLILVVSIGFFIGFGKSKSKNENEMLVNVKYPTPIKYDDYEAKRKNIEENPINDEYLEAVNEFAYKTGSKILSDEKGNINYSPISFYYALAMATTGANGETAEELHSLMGVDSNEELSEQAGNLYRQLFFENEIGSLKIANSLWLDSKLNVKEPFVKNTADNFYASTYKVNFGDKQTGKLMSKWVSENTKGTIEPQIVPNPSQIMSILNTIYFYDQWENSFSEDKTKKGVFNTADNKTVNVDYMNKTDMSNTFYVGENFARASLRLKNGGSMVFVLPNRDTDISSLTANEDTVENALTGGEKSNGTVVWQIPKFKMSSETDLIDILKKLGISHAFDKTADFGNITDEKIFINNIKQQTHIAIGEKGLEASGFTNIGFAKSAMPMGKIEMILDRPFMYAVVSRNGAVLFMGICNNPTE